MIGRISKILFTIAGVVVVFGTRVMSLPSQNSIPMTEDSSILDHGNCGSESCTHA